MSSLTVVFRTEITRLARKEAKKLVEPVRKATTAYRHEIAALKRQVAELMRTVALAKRAPPAAAPADDTPARFSARSLRSLRRRLGLSAENFGVLAGVTGQTIYHWEAEKAVPRRANLPALARLRELTKQQAQEQLAGLKASRSKRAKVARKGKR